ncbi:MAG: patatin-like phospholipase family protein [Pseudomonadota bacterium]
MHGAAVVGTFILEAMRVRSKSMLASLCWTCMLLALTLPAVAQDVARAGATDVAIRPRIGLVLSGGGARGAAHVGVLKVLEQMHIPIDAIAGTSMGAVVGGLYASGMSAAEIERQFASVDWNEAFRDRPQRLELNVRRKREDREYPVQFPLGFRDGQFQLPSGLIQGQKLTQILRQLTLPVAQVSDFDHLPTRFRAVATDLETGDPVVIDRGDLVTALRASVSAPGIFAPVEREGRLLVDGGIAKNLPVDIARAMGVDVLIVVDVGFPLSTREQLRSVAAVSNQMLAILIRKESEKQRALMRPGDILISPPLERTSSFDFSKLPRTVALGEAAGHEVAAQLAALSINGEQYEGYMASRRQGAPASAPEVGFVRVDAASQAYAATVAALFGDLAGMPLDSKELQKRVNRYYGQGVLETLDYRLEAQDPVGGTGPTGLTITARRNSWGPNYLRFALRLQDDFDGNSTYDAAARIVFTELNSLGAEWTWDGQIGENPLIGTEVYLPFSLQQRWFVAPHALFQISNVPEVVNEERVGELRVRSLRYGADLGRAINNSGELRLGLEGENGSFIQRFQQVPQPRESFDTAEYFLRYSLDTLDSVSFPRRGDALGLEWRGQLGDLSRDQVSNALRFDFRTVHSWGRNTGIFWTTAGSLLDPQFTDSRNFFPLGGFLNLSGLQADTLSGPQLGIVRLIYMRKLGNGGEGFLNLPLYAGASFETGNTWRSRSDMDFGSARKDFSVFMGVDTFVGPVYFAVGYDTMGSSAMYLSVGRGY